MTEQLVAYIESNIFPRYVNNDAGHQLSHIKYVIDRSLMFMKQAMDDKEKYLVDGDINEDMVYVIAAYHDIGHHIDSKRHESISAEIMINDRQLRTWFSPSELQIMYDAICDHRASSHDEPRTIYGKIVSSADRSTDIESILKRTYAYGRKLHPTMTLDSLVEESYRHIVNKFGDCGYANSKMYFYDKQYSDFLLRVQTLISSISIFKCLFVSTNNLNKKGLLDRVRNYVPSNEQEVNDKIAMIKFMDSFGDVVTRDNIFGHFTASAFVVNENRTKALMLHHKIMNDWIYPGGHADGEYDLQAVALREVEEETGLQVSPIFDDEIYAIQAAPVKGHFKNGKYISAHIHYDILFLFQAKNEDMDEIRVLESENKAVEWWPLNETFENKNVVDWAKDVNRKIVQKIIEGDDVHGA